MVGLLEIKQYAKKAAQASGAKQVFLFGSHARGQAHQDSDVDMLLVFDQPTDLMKAAQKAYAACQDRSFALDITPMHYSHLVGMESFIAEAVLAEGIQVYVQS